MESIDEVLAGFGRVEITPQQPGQRLIGYASRGGPAEGIHDRLYARALVVKQGIAAWALCALDVCLVPPSITAEVRRIVAEQTGLPPGAVMLAATHTHSAPLLIDRDNWHTPVAELIAQAIVMAWQAAEPARIAAGAGLLTGHSINRRWLDRPVDPAVGVVRIDSAGGRTLGMLLNFACHPVVLGADNRLVSADYVGYTTALVEQELGGVCLFTNGGCADVNPLTAAVRRAIGEGRLIRTMAPGARYYGGGSGELHIGDRAGGSFAEAEELGLALGREALAVARGLTPHLPQRPPWSVLASANHLDDAAEPPELIDVQALGIGDFALAGYPGEVFGETALAVKAGLRAHGFTNAWLVSYANDWQSYLTPAAAFPEGGYEVDCALAERHSPRLTDRLWAALSAAIGGPPAMPEPHGSPFQPLSRWARDPDAANRI